MKRIKRFFECGDYSFFLFGPRGTGKSTWLSGNLKDAYLIDLLDHRYVLTGSSARKLKRTGVDLLGGRALKLNMHPFMACELGADFSLDEALETGLIPVIGKCAK